MERFEGFPPLQKGLSMTIRAASLDMYLIGPIFSKTREYCVFCTRECYYWIQQMRDNREKDGEIITDETPLFRCRMNHRDRHNINMKDEEKFIPGGIKKKIRNLLRKAHIIVHMPPMPSGYKVNKVQMAHGIRKYFNTVLTNHEPKLAHLFKELFMGHDVALDVSYYGKTNPESLKKMLEQYLIVEHDLTIDRLEYENIELREQNERLEDDMTVQGNTLEHKYDQMAEMVKEMRKENQELRASVKQLIDSQK